MDPTEPQTDRSVLRTDSSVLPLRGHKATPDGIITIITRMLMTSAADGIRREEDVKEDLRDLKS